MTQITLTQPDDWHLHVRDGVAMASVIQATARCFGRAIIMPNLKPPVISLAQAETYRSRILQALPEGSTFQPLMTLYLTDNTSVEEIKRLKESESVVAIKYYPAGATTNSESGVTDLHKVWHLLEAMQTYDVPLLIHGEVTANTVDIFDREKVFIEYILDSIILAFPNLRIVLEHITTAEAVDYVSAQSSKIGATITAHHLLMNRNDLFTGGVRPHHYCLPVLKREQHRQALLRAATSGNPKFFLGTDSAPHARHTKEASCGCAGMFTAPAALELYAEAFEQVNALDKLEGFASFYGADFYGVARNTRTVTLKKQCWQMPTSLAFGDDTVVPLRAGDDIQWQLVTG
ncbi:dihydroorotase, homodimeric type [Beggiatoa alba B18LD]|uniref:Dihydroorotase n=1 Tax=Beggiatoa alba B18LD TaxID=395493 RepID=I3CKA7_9GAMM|nr:dihydroorotase [Beggiatoa alba]EIJ44050.1 dihydroorotase, homodimeric type [Beggiatoa alba B18LD]